MQWMFDLTWLKYALVLDIKMDKSCLLIKGIDCSYIGNVLHLIFLLISLRNSAATVYMIHLYISWNCYCKFSNLFSLQ